MRATVIAAVLCVAPLSGPSACEQAPDRPPPSSDRLGKACAAYDLHILTRIEDHGARDELPGAALIDAFAAQQRARDLCRSACMAEGLATYEASALPAPGREFLR